jgi:hypothetical protein
MRMEHTQMSKNTTPEAEFSDVPSRSQITEHTILLRFLGIILRVLRPEVSIFNVYIKTQFQTNFAQKGGGGEKFGGGEKIRY